MWQKIKLFFNHQRYQTIAMLVVVGVCLWLFSCANTVPSMNGSREKVNSEQLQLEIDHFLAKAEQRFEELDQQNKIKRLIFDTALIVTSGGAVNPVGIITTLAAIFGVGATVDNVRKRKVANKTNS